MSNTPGQVPVQCVQPDAAGYYDPHQQQPCVPQQMQHRQQGTSFYSQMPQVQFLTSYPAHSSYTQPIAHQHQHYDTSFPALPVRFESPWQKVEYKKRPSDNPDTRTQNVKQIKLNDYWLNPPLPQTTNRFDALMDETNEEGEVETTRNTPKAPPIFVSGVQNIQPLKELLVAVAGDDFELKVLTGNQVKIQPKAADKYKAIIQALAEKHTEFHTYQPKGDRSFRTVLRGMHYSTDISEIKSAIEEHGHAVMNVFNVKQNRTNIPLSLFFIDLKPSETNKDIYQIESLNHTKVKFEPPRPKRTIPQCSKCQRYGHTQAYCYHSPRCVKCAGNHHTKQCPRKERSEQVKCALCDGNHPANYKGCTVYKDIQKRTFPPLRIHQDQKNQHAPLQPQNAPPNSYAAALKSHQHQYESATPHTPQKSSPPTNSQPPTNVIQETQAMLRGLMEQMSSMLSLITTLISKLA